jgi:hypothetical protein
MSSGSLDSPPYIGAQDLMKLASIYDALTLLKLLLDNYGYVYLEGTNLSENGAFIIHPANWPKSDIESAKKCWPAMERADLQFVGVNAPESVNGHTPKHFDGILNGMACELKFMNSNTVNFKKNVINKVDDASGQGAELLVIVLDEELKISDNELVMLNKIALKRIYQRKRDPLFSKTKTLLESAIVIKK